MQEVRLSPVQIFYSSDLPCADANIVDPTGDESLETCPLLSESHVTCWYDWIRTGVSEEGVGFMWARLMSSKLNNTGVNDATMSKIEVFRSKSEKVIDGFLVLSCFLIVYFQGFLSWRVCVHVCVVASRLVQPMKVIYVHRAPIPSPALFPPCLLQLLRQT